MEGLAQSRREINKFFVHAVFTGWFSATAGRHYIPDLRRRN
jgi:hypothetical protein